jgi:glycosyltransferase involved in cell wall biosynthesis
MSVRISIVINNFNYARFLRESIDSALAQTHSETEVIVVDDLSTDESPDIIRSYGDRIRAVLLEQNGGQGAALNAGFAASRGEVVIFLDADDYLYPEAAAWVAKAWREGIAILQYRLHLRDAAAGKIVDLYPMPEVKFDSGDVVPKLLTTGRYEGTVTSGNAFARAALEKVMPIPTETFRISADGYLLTTVPFYGEVSSLDNALGVYRMHGGNLWATAPSLAKRFRRALLHDLDRHRYLTERAAMFHRTPELSLGLRDCLHVSLRMGSLCLDAVNHPFPSDTRLQLAVHGIRSTAWAPIPLRRRSLIWLWFIITAVLPVSLSRRVVGLFLDTASQPLSVRRILRLLRRASS